MSRLPPQYVADVVEEDKVDEQQVGSDTVTLAFEPLVAEPTEEFKMEETAPVAGSDVPPPAAVAAIEEEEIKEPEEQVELVHAQAIEPGEETAVEAPVPDDEQVSLPSDVITPEEELEEPAHLNAEETAPAPEPEPLVELVVEAPTLAESQATPKVLATPIEEEEIDGQEHEVNVDVAPSPEQAVEVPAEETVVEEPAPPDESHISPLVAIAAIDEEVQEPEPQPETDAIPAPEPVIVDLQNEVGTEEPVPAIESHVVEKDVIVPDATEATQEVVEVSAPQVEATYSSRNPSSCLKSP